MKFPLRILLFLTLNFAALAIGGLFTGGGVISEWYNELNKAPWTPPGYVFGLAWTTIMICYSIYMAIIYQRQSDRKTLMYLFILQLILNISWNPLFFYLQFTILSLFSIVLLTLLMFYFLIRFYSNSKRTSILLLPYCIWLCIATSLNLYIVLYN